MHRRWQPLFKDSRRTEAVQIAREILVAALREPAGPHDWGIPLLATYLREHGDDTEAICDEAVHAAIASASESGRPWLYGGVAGTGWLIAHLHHRSGRDTTPDLSDPDEFLLELVGEADWPYDYDLISGLVGMSVYWMERYADVPLVAAEGMSRIVDRLSSLALHDSHGASWMTPPGRLPAWQRSLAPEGYYNLGVAHGMPGILWTLSKACSADCRRSVASSLLEQGTKWLVSMGGRHSETYPSWLTPGTVLGTDSTPVRGTGLAWCYGGLGIASALLAAGLTLGDTSLIETAKIIGRRMCRLKNGPADAGFCHGIGGVAHLFNVLYQNTGEECFHNAADHWFRSVIAFRKGDDAGIAGFPAWTAETPSSPSRWERDATFLTGACGTGLALLAAASAEPPDWDVVVISR